MQHPYSNARDNAEDGLSSSKYHYTHPPPNATHTSNFEIYRGAIQRMFDRTGEFSGMPSLDSQLKEDLVEYFTVEEESEDDDDSVDFQADTQISGRPAHLSTETQVPITCNKSPATGSSRRSAPSAALAVPQIITPEERTYLMMTNVVPTYRIKQRTYAVEFYTSMVPSLPLFRMLEEGAGRRPKHSSAAERLQHFNRDPWVTGVQPFHVLCVGCGREVITSEPRHYGLSKWLRHRNLCDGVYEKWCSKNGKTSNIFSDKYQSSRKDVRAILQSTSL